MKEVYSRLYSSIKEILKYLDADKCSEFVEKYEKSYYMSFNKSLEEMENVTTEMIRDYAKFIVPLSNNKVSINTIIKAAKNVRKNLNGYDKKALSRWEMATRLDNEMKELNSFPYKYDKDDPEGYLEINSPKKK